MYVLTKSKSDSLLVKREIISADTEDTHNFYTLVATLTPISPPINLRSRLSKWIWQWLSCGTAWSERFRTILQCINGSTRAGASEKGNVRASLDYSLSRNFADLWNFTRRWDAGVIPVSQAYPGRNAFVSFAIVTSSTDLVYASAIIVTRLPFTIVSTRPRDSTGLVIDVITIEEM